MSNCLSVAFEVYKEQHHTRHGVDEIGDPIQIAGHAIYPLEYIDQSPYINGAMYSDGTPVNAELTKVLGGTRIVTDLIVKSRISRECYSTWLWSILLEEEKMDITKRMQDPNNYLILAHDTKQKVYTAIDLDTGSLYEPKVGIIMKGILNVSGNRYSDLIGAADKSTYPLQESEWKKVGELILPSRVN